MRLIYRIIVFATALTVTVSCQALPEGVNPVMATWLYGNHTIPSTVTISGSTKTVKALPEDPPWTDLAANELKSGIKLPAVLYMHGCNGISSEAEQYRTLLLSQGYVFFMPDSFERPGRRACGKEGSLGHRVNLRLEEIAYALKKVRELSWVDQSRIILMGFSEGGNAVDNWTEKGFSAHIILGSACTLVGGELVSADGIPVLAIVGGRDKYRPGRSCTIRRTIGGSKSIVIPGAGHRISGHIETQEAIKQFLRQCCQ